MRHILNVASALAQVAVGDLFVDRKKAIGDGADCPLGIGAIVEDKLLDLTAESPILKHEDVSIEDVRVLFAKGCVEACFGLLELAAGDLDSIPETRDLGLKVS
jgi:hypothetical protein